MGLRKKRQSKRQSFKDKYKIKKKVAEHNRKQRREARKNPNKRKKLKKDPGLPNLYPYKEQLLKHVQRQEEASRLYQLQSAKDGMRKRSYEDMMNEVSEKQSQFENQKIVKKIEGNEVLKDNSRKNFYREFKEVVKASDVILEIVDARDPIGTRSKSIEKQIRAIDADKKIVLVLNKIDLVPKSNVKNWLKYFWNEMPAVAFKASTQKQGKNIGRVDSNTSQFMNDREISTTAQCIGADQLIQLLKNYSRSHNSKKSIMVGLIGFPNVGKSSIINSLKRSSAVGVGANPGFTRKAQIINLDKDLKLIDCPGIVFDPGHISASDAALRNCILIEQLDDILLPIEAIIKRCQREKLMEVYKIASFDDAQTFLALVAKKRGKLVTGGAANMNEAAKIVINDWNKGRIPYYTIPPETKDIQLETKIVQEFGQEFKIEFLNNETDMEVNDVDEYYYSAIPADITVDYGESMAMKINEDSMEDEDKPQIAIGNIRKKRKVDIYDDEDNMLDEINPKINQAIKKSLAEISKSEKKENKIEENADAKEEKYDFNVDFWGSSSAQPSNADDQAFDF